MDAKEVVSYRNAFDLVADYLGSGDPITEGLVREIHKRLVRGFPCNAAAPGEYRGVQNSVRQLGDQRDHLHSSDSGSKLPR